MHITLFWNACSPWNSSFPASSLALIQPIHAIHSIHSTRSIQSLSQLVVSEVSFQEPSAQRWPVPTTHGPQKWCHQEKTNYSSSNPYLSQALLAEAGYICQLAKSMFVYRSLSLSSLNCRHAVMLLWQQRSLVTWYHICCVGDWYMIICVRMCQEFKSYVSQCIPLIGFARLLIIHCYQVTVTV